MARKLTMMSSEYYDIWLFLMIYILGWSILNSFILRALDTHQYLHFQTLMDNILALIVLFKFSSISTIISRYLPDEITKLDAIIRNTKKEPKGLALRGRSSRINVAYVTKPVSTNYSDVHGVWGQFTALLKYFSSQLTGDV